MFAGVRNVFAFWGTQTNFAQPLHPNVHVDGSKQNDDSQMCIQVKN